jgi:hypothetical protein
LAAVGASRLEKISLSAARSSFASSVTCLGRTMRPKPCFPLVLVAYRDPRKTRFGASAAMGYGGGHLDRGKVNVSWLIL